MVMTNNIFQLIFKNGFNVRSPMPSKVSILGPSSNLFLLFTLYWVIQVMPQFRWLPLWIMPLSYSFLLFCFHEISDITFVSAFLSCKVFPGSPSQYMFYHVLSCFVLFCCSPESFVLLPLQFRLFSKPKVELHFSSLFPDLPF